ncbi:MAG: barstar family protein [Oscillospiraceae bacterium]|nr:barstar family protein [Oscillospiraceae bacterium]
MRETLGFPDYYGCNLDALHDCLTDIFEPTTVILRGARNAGTYMQGYVNVAVEVFTQSARENSHLRVVEE